MSRPFARRAAALVTVLVFPSAVTIAAFQSSVARTLLPLGVARGNPEPVEGLGSRLIAQTGERQPVLTKEDQEEIAEFQKLVDDYVKLRERARVPIMALSKEATGQQIEQFEIKARDAIVRARANARAGAIFHSDIREYIRRQLSAVFSRPDGASVRASILDENPIGTPIRINGPYPENLPLTTMPPQLLESLPKLPMEIEYRFVGDRLILFDASVELVLDYIDRALPAVVRTR